MELRILGSSGGKSTGSNPTSFLLDNRMLIDCGTVMQKLPPGKLISEVNSLILTHAHFDHIADLPFLVQLMFEQGDKKFDVYASWECTEAVFSGIFNTQIWPDLFRISSQHDGRLKWHRYNDLEKFVIDRYTIEPVFVNHSVPTYGLIIDDGSSSFAFTADTYITDTFWDRCNLKDNLRAVIVDVSFPSGMLQAAEATKHLNTELLAEEIRKLDSENAVIYITHIKPMLKEEIETEIPGSLSGKTVHILEEDTTISI